jgi:putative spermidine/putrescine transport system ATP-binding protein
VDPQIGTAAGSEVRLDRLTKSYGSFRAVDDLSLTAQAGQFFTIVGPSGSGKTTILMMIAGFTYPDAGEILLDGRAVTRLPPQAREIGMVFQNYALFPHLTIFENLAFPLRVRNVSKTEIARRVKEMLGVVRLEGLEDRTPQQLSGGQQQRVALARALVFGPRLVLLDEPLGALDKKLRTQMQLEIKHIQQRLNLTVIYITHDQEEALTMSDRVAVMNRGRIEQIGSPDDLYEHPANRFVADFLGESNFLEGHVAAADGGRYLMRTKAGNQFWGTSLTLLQVGQPIAAAVRPEKITLRDEPASGANTCCGAIAEVIYVGDATRYRIRLNAGTELTAKLQNRRDLTLQTQTGPVQLAWDAADMHLFPADGT